LATDSTSASKGKGFSFAETADVVAVSVVVMGVVVGAVDVDWLVDCELLLEVEVGFEDAPAAFEVLPDVAEPDDVALVKAEALLVAGESEAAELPDVADPEDDDVPPVAAELLDIVEPLAETVSTDIPTLAVLARPFDDPVPVDVELLDDVESLADVVSVEDADPLDADEPPAVPVPVDEESLVDPEMLNDDGSPVAAVVSPLAAAPASAEAVASPLTLVVEEVEVLDIVLPELVLSDADTELELDDASAAAAIPMPQRNNVSIINMSFITILLKRLITIPIFFFLDTVALNQTKPVQKDDLPLNAQAVEHFLIFILLNAYIITYFVFLNLPYLNQLSHHSHSAMPSRAGQCCFFMTHILMTRIFMAHIFMTHVSIALSVVFLGSMKAIMAFVSVHLQVLAQFLLQSCQSYRHRRIRLTLSDRQQISPETLENYLPNLPDSWCRQQSQKIHGSLQMIRSQRQQRPNSMTLQPQRQLLHLNCTEAI